MNTPAPARPETRRSAPSRSGWSSPDSGVRMLGPLPLVNVVVLEAGLAAALLVLALDTGLLPVAAAIVVVALAIAFGRRDRRWLTEWLPAKAGFTMRARQRSLAAAPADPPPAGSGPGDSAPPGAGDRRPGVLALAAPGLTIVPTASHDRVPLALLHDQDEWASVLLVRPSQSLLTSTGGGIGLPLPTLASCLEDRGVLLRRIRIVWHSYPGSTALPAGAPAAVSYQEVLGSLPTVARRTTWITIGLDPGHCPDAVAERGGGEVGARRALVGATSRVRRALTDQGVSTGMLDQDGVLRAGVVALDLASVTGAGGPVDWSEQWDHVSVGGVGHRIYALTGFPDHLPEHALENLTAVRAQSVTVALSLSKNGEEGTVRLSGLLRVSANSVAELGTAEQQIRTTADRIGISLKSLQGRHGAALSATLPLVGAVR